MIDALDLSMPPATARERRAEVLRRFGATQAELDELLVYTQIPFNFSGPLVLLDEPFTAVWEEYLAASEVEGVFPVLQRVLHQLRFPVREGMSGEGAYAAATRRGDLSALGTGGLFEEGLQLRAPGRLRLELHPTPAGRIPVLTAPVREDFVALVQALARRNEPVPLPDSMGALMISGYNNWDRVRRYRKAWEDEAPAGETWVDAFQRLIPQKPRYQDRMILLSEGPYSAVPAADLGLDEAEWLDLSHAIRKEHESAHYYCKRVLGTMRYHVFDEMIADAYGLAAGAGAFRPAWLLRFFGLHHGGPFPQEGGRMWNYSDGLSHDAVRVLAALVRRWVQAVAAVMPATPVAGARDQAALIRSLASAGLGDVDEGPNSKSNE